MKIDSKKYLMILFSIIWVSFLFWFLYNTITKVDFNRRFFFDGISFGFFFFLGVYILRRWYDEIKKDKKK